MGFAPSSGLAHHRSAGQWPVITYVDFSLWRESAHGLVCYRPLDVLYEAVSWTLCASPTEVRMGIPEVERLQMSYDPSSVVAAQAIVLLQA